MSEVQDKRKPVFNVWDSNASQKGIERATDRIVKSIADEGRDSKKAIVDAVKVGSDKITDAVGKIKPLNNAEESLAPTPAVKAVCHGLKDVSKSISQLADDFYSNPGEWAAVGEKTVAANERLGKIVDSVKRCADGLEQLQSATTEASNVAGWIGSSLPSGGGGGNGGRTQTCHVGNNAFGSLWERYGG